MNNSILYIFIIKITIGCLFKNRIYRILHLIFLQGYKSAIRTVVLTYFSITTALCFISVYGPKFSIIVIAFEALINRLIVRVSTALRFFPRLNQQYRVCLRNKN